MKLTRRSAFGAAWIVLLAATLFAAAAQQRSAARMAEAARNFIAALSDEQRAKALKPFDAPERLDWHFVPKAERKGLPLMEMDGAQAHLAHALLSSGASQAGYAKAANIMSLETHLKALEVARGGSPMVPLRDPGRYYFTIFGEPSEKGPWGWSIEGHHISLNFTVVNGELAAASPSFLGANPHEIAEGPRKGFRPLAAEEDRARELLAALDAAQAKRAIIAEKAPNDILTSAARKAAIEGAPQGLPSKDMTEAQRALLTALIEEYISGLPEDLAAARRARAAAADPGALYFAWMGPAEKAPGNGNYYRVQGSTFLIEYDNVQNNANHSHSVWRDYEGDFGLDLLAKHYAEAHDAGAGQRTALP